MEKNEIYPKAFAEVYFIIKCLPEEDQKKISPKFIKFLFDNKDNNYQVKIDPNKELLGQELLKETRGILREIYLSYFISKEHRKELLDFEKKYKY